MAVAVLAIDAVVSGVAGNDPHRQSLLGSLTPPGLPTELQLVSVLAGLALLVVAPRLWRGTRTAVALAVAGLATLALVSLLRDHWSALVVQVALAVALGLSRQSFRVGCRNRPKLAVVCAAVGAWGLAFLALRLAPIGHSRASHGLLRALHHAVRAGHLSALWLTTIEGLTVAAAVISALALRSLLRPGPAANHHVESEYRLARALVDAHGTDSLSPFLLRPDKALHFAAGGVLSYRVIGGTAVVSADPVAPGDAAGEVLDSFQGAAHRQGWDVALWGASAEHLDAYRRLGLHAVCVGEEAFVDPARFTLEGRPVRKLRQSVHRVARRGWEIGVFEGRAIDDELEAEMDALERTWRAQHPQLLGFAMAMGPYDAEVGPDDLYVIARSPEGRLGAVMRFVSYSGKLSLDTMRRVGETPNGLNEALVARALQTALQRGVPEVSLNYAGLAHLVRGEPARDPVRRALTALVMVPLSRRFQMERLVRFNEKFSPEWRPRYLVYESRSTLPKAILRVLQAEGYVPEPTSRRLRFPARPAPRTVAGSAQAGRAG